jgi:hypothetical protein
VTARPARFRAVLDLCLGEDDATALPELAVLAAEGNRAAQILLALEHSSRRLRQR